MKKQMKELGTAGYIALLAALVSLLAAVSSASAVWGS
jgi:hypothetical protein